MLTGFGCTIKGTSLPIAALRMRIVNNPHGNGKVKKRGDNGAARKGEKVQH